MLEEAHHGDNVDLTIVEKGTLPYRSHLCVLNVEDLRRELREEAHCSRHTIHPGGTKMDQVFLVDGSPLLSCNVLYANRLE